MCKYDFDTPIDRRNTGRVFDRAELERLCDFCLKNNTIICSDEIHCDLLLDGDKRHMPTAALSPDISKQVITLMAPSKTYNIPGLDISFIEATYLAWIDCWQTGFAGPGAFFENAGVGLSDVIEFGVPIFLHLNFARSRGKLEKSLEKMKQAMALRLIAKD